MMMIKQIQFVPNESEREENQCNRPQNKSERIDPTILFHGYAINRINCKNALLIFDYLFSRLFLRISKACVIALATYAMMPSQSPVLPNVFILSPFAGVDIRMTQNTTVRTQNRTSRIQLTFVLFILLGNLETEEEEYPDDKGYH